MSPRSPQLERLLKEAGLTGPHLEIGTDRAQTLAFMMRCYPEPTRPQFVAIDTFNYFPNQRECVDDTLRREDICPASVEFRKGTSWSLLPAALARHERYSFILIDAVHTVLNVVQDLRWTRMLEPGGYVCMHDYKSKFRGVIWAVDWFLFRNRNYRQVDLVGSLIILQKTAAGSPEVSDLDLVLAKALELIHRAVTHFKRH